MTTTRTALLPDLNGDLTAALNHVEELLLTFAAWADDDAELEFPAPLADADDSALTAVRRLWDAIAPTQGDRAVQAGCTGRQLGPDGQYEHIPLRLVEVDPADVATLAAAARVLGDPHAGDFVRDAVEEAADAIGDPYRTPGDLVARVAQLAGVLDLADTPETVMLRDRLADVGPAADVTFTRAEEDAYQATADRFNAMWTGGNPLDRYTY